MASKSWGRRIVESDAADKGFGPDGKAIGADFIALQLIIDRQYQLAAQIYEMLAIGTVQWRETSDQPRHAGRFYANLGTARALLGDVDRACIAFWRAAEEDQLTNGTDPKKSFAISEMFESSFGNPAREFAWEAAKSVNFRVVADEIKTLSDSLGPSKYAFLAYLHVGRIHETEAHGLESDFSYLQKLNVIRSLSVILETEIRKVCGTTKESILKSLERHALAGKIIWYNDFDARRVAVGATLQSTTPVDDQLKAALSTTVTCDDQRFWRSVLIGYIARNFSAHQMDITPSFLRTSFKLVVGHIVNAMIYAQNYR